MITEAKLFIDRSDKSMLKVYNKQVVDYGGGLGSFLLNLVWIVLVGIWMALGHAITGVLLCCTVIGIPFGLQHFKIAKLALMPFGTQVF